LVRQIVLELIHDYEVRDGALEIADDDGYMIQVKDEYASLTNEFVPMELPVAVVRTLSAIAIKQPIPQSEIIKIRGAGAYDHIKELLERELIHKKEEGRSPTLTTTKKFQEYFRLSQDAKALRTELKSQIADQEDSDTSFDATPTESENILQKALESGTVGLEPASIENQNPTKEAVSSIEELSVQ